MYNYMWLFFKHKALLLDTLKVSKFKWLRDWSDCMHINIAELFSQTVKDVEVDHSFEYTEIAFGADLYMIKEPIRIHMDLSKLDNEDYLAKGSITTTLTIPCDRCMDDVIKKVEADFVKEFRTNPHDEDEESHEYLRGSVLDLEKLVLDEVYMNVPMKVLCSEDCLGICKSCGKNLNHTACDCEDDNVDPRLAGLKDLFNDQFKEV